MRSRSHSLLALVKVAHALDADAAHVVVVGAAAAATYALGPLVADIRPTEDIDLVVEVRTKIDFDRFVGRLESRGVLNHVLDEDAPICRYRIAGVLVDIVPVDVSVLGFTNQWYAEAAAGSVSCGGLSKQRTELGADHCERD